MTNYTRATEAADAENWLAAIAFAVLAVVDEFRLPDPNALDEIRTVVTNWATQQMTCEEAAKLYDKTLLAMHPDKVLIERMAVLGSTVLVSVTGDGEQGG